MDKLKLTGQNLGWFFNTGYGRACERHTVTFITKTAKLKAENSAKTTFRLSNIDTTTIIIMTLVIMTILITQNTG